MKSKLIHPGNIVEEIELTPTQEAAALLAIETSIAGVTAQQYKEDRRTAYEAKGWYEWHDYEDDCITRGRSVVEAERQAIKDAFPVN